jgi:uncharacterized membrane protein
MTILILGLVIFLGVHSVRIVADGWRGAQIERLGAARWKGLYSIASAVGLVLIVWGYGITRAAPVDLWSPPAWTRSAAALLMLVSFTLFAAAYVPRTHVKAAFGHPMMLGTKAWALAHLVSNGRLGDVLLFGAFLAWAVAGYIAARRRDRASGTVYPAGSIGRDALAFAAGAAATVVFILWLHGWLIGVQPIG